MKTIQIGNLSIDIHDSRIGHMMSGGADSAILFYILMKYAPGPIDVFTCANPVTHNQEVEVAVKVINYIMKKIKRHDVYYHAYWEDTKVTGNTLNSNLANLLDLSVIYSAFTTPPPTDALGDFDRSVLYGGTLEPGVVYPYYHDSSSPYRPKEYDNLKGIIYTPFSNIDKKGVANLYKELDVMDIYSVTRSCESPTLIGGHCGTCWWCKERLYAFGRLE